MCSRLIIRLPQPYVPVHVCTRLLCDIDNKTIFRHAQVDSSCPTHRYPAQHRPRTTDHQLPTLKCMSYSHLTLTQEALRLEISLPGTDSAASPVRRIARKPKCCLADIDMHMWMEYEVTTCKVRKCATTPTPTLLYEVLPWTANATVACIHAHVQIHRDTAQVLNSFYFCLRTYCALCPHLPLSEQRSHKHDLANLRSRFSLAPPASSAFPDLRTVEGV